MGSVSAGKTVTVRNISALAVTLNSFTASSEFQVAGHGTVPCSGGLSLSPNGTCTVSVMFAPTPGASKSVSGAIAFSDNAAVNQQILNVKGTSNLPLSFSPTALTFATQTVATASAPQTVTVTNNESSSLNLSIAGDGEFVVSAGGGAPCGAALAANGSCTFAVTFTPSAIGLRSGDITVTDGANPGVQTVPLTGTGQ